MEKSSPPPPQINSINGASPSPAPSPRTPQPLTPKTIPSPSPTTFIQADPSSFKRVVQMLTGSTDTAANRITTSPPPPAVKAIAVKRPSFKLYERRKATRGLKMIAPLPPSSARSLRSVSTNSTNSSSSSTEVPSPSKLDMPALALSPLTPSFTEPFNKQMEEEGAIADKGFYLHPSPRSAPPRLLPLFPMTSPRISASSSP